uniref:Uncharacterized protein n=1 Tax=Anguilla anguilla TaxID=7936 RepID=A0A0E9RY52_ANGAN
MQILADHVIKVLGIISIVTLANFIHASEM